MFGLDFWLGRNIHTSIIYLHQLNFGLIQKHFLNGSLLKNLGRHYIFLRVDEWQIP